MPLRGEAWAGDAADTYHDHREKLGRGVTEVVEAAEAFAAALAASAGALADRAERGWTTRWPGPAARCRPRWPAAG